MDCVASTRHFTAACMNSPLNPALNADLHCGNSFSPTELRAGALACLIQTESAMKVACVQALASEWHGGRLALHSGAALSTDAAIPGRPARPELVSPLQVKHRSMRTEEGRAAMIHALAHIEFNAINLALSGYARSVLCRLVAGGKRRGVSLLVVGSAPAGAWLFLRRFSCA